MIEPGNIAIDLQEHSENYSELIRSQPYVGSRGKALEYLRMRSILAQIDFSLEPFRPF